MTRFAAADPAAAAPALPVPHRLVAKRRETGDVWPREWEPPGGALEPLAPGQFAMLYAFGAGEVPISVSAEPRHHTIRAVGAVTSDLCALEGGAYVGVRGPLGRAWPLAPAE